MSPSPFSRESIKKSVDEVEAKRGNSVDVGVEAVPGERPDFTVEAQGGERVTWGAWAKTKFTKATTAVGAKIGVKW